MVCILSSFLSRFSLHLHVNYVPMQHISILDREVGAATTLFNMRLNADLGSWAQHTSPWAATEFGNAPSRFYKRHQYGTRDSNSRQPPYHSAQKNSQSLNIGDEVCVIGCREGQAKRYNSQWGIITSHRTKSPWYTVHFRDGKTVPVRSHCLHKEALLSTSDSLDSGSVSDSSLCSFE